MHIKKGDLVLIMAGKDAGKKGKVLRVIPDAHRVVVEGVNKVSKHQRPNRSFPQGGILKIENPLNASNVMLLCGKCNKPTRVGKKILDNQEKVRVCKKCGEVLD
ncbi:MAG: 50S ribosomal protein L24 [Syntrophomonadaceae bacterium]|nr:50S ribosomal protein L24 [Syntrophomonadaceae bacterium]MDD3889169.1 50S ribosomal protein L24 [Syntrophomonadaceae bacterium]MDD4549300.1 50S ribosomal protein L24 [Syntrophomonadaceae bacterium]